MSSSSGHRLVTFLSSKTIKPFICNDLREVISNPIKFHLPSGLAIGDGCTTGLNGLRIGLKNNVKGFVKNAEPTNGKLNKKGVL